MGEKISGPIKSAEELAAVLDLPEGTAAEWKEGFGKVCEHGSLKRKCPHCQYAEDEREYLVKIADQAATITTLEQQNAKLRDALEAQMESTVLLLRRQGFSEEDVALGTAQARAALSQTEPSAERK